LKQTNVPEACNASIVTVLMEAVHTYETSDNFNETTVSNIAAVSYGVLKSIQILPILLTVHLTKT
jgi:hypothetical protein